MLDLPCLSSYRDAWWRILSCPVVGWLRNFSNSRIRRLFPFFTCPQLSTIPLIHAYQRHPRFLFVLCSSLQSERRAEKRIVKCTSGPLHRIRAIRGLSFFSTSRVRRLDQSLVCRKKGTLIFTNQH